ncbi:MAG: glycosyltransferase family 39 protein, partial [Bacteroidales bacterium]|nr:glycosyltransferase family 39 protein [Bacteroidales bacterium]
GVAIDGHPPLVQVFLYYWAKLFGNAEWIIKLPFTLCGLGSLIFAYLIGKRWFNHTVGLIVAAFLSTMEYTVMYSHVARPYMSGLFFALAMVYFWTTLIQKPEKKNLLPAIFYVLFAVCCSYNHHFSLLFTAIVGISGLFFLRGKSLIKYIIINACIVILYLPNLPLLFAQLNIGGVEEWLGKPHNDWLVGYVQYLFHFSIIVDIAVFLLIFMGWRQPSKKPSQWLILSAVWFFLPFLIGFFYSRYVNAVLQYSSLIFSFVFLLLLLFGQIKKQSSVINFIIVILILSCNIFTLIYKRQYYQLFYQDRFKTILLDHQKAQKKYENIHSLISWESYMSYYSDKYSVEKNFTSLSDMETLIHFLKTKSETVDYLYVGMLSSYPSEFIPVIRDYYPHICETHYYSAATTTVYAKNNKQCHHILHDDTLLFSDPETYKIDSAQIYASEVKLPLKKLITHENNFIDISLEVYGNGMDSSILVADLSSNEQNIYWDGSPFYRYVQGKEVWSKVYLTLKLSDIYLNYRNIELKIYVWNLHGEKVKIRNLIVKRREGNRFVYGLLENIP